MAKVSRNRTLYVFVFLATAVGAVAAAAAAPVQTWMEQVAAVAVCDRDRLRACTAWRICGRLRKTKIFSKSRQNNFEILTH